MFATSTHPQFPPPHTDSDTAVFKLTAMFKFSLVNLFTVKCPQISAGTVNVNLVTTCALFLVFSLLELDLFLKYPSKSGYSYKKALLLLTLFNLFRSVIIGLGP